MTFYNEPTTVIPSRGRPINQFWLAISKRVQRARQVQSRNGGAKKRVALPNSGMPLSNDISTKLSIRAGLTAGPW
jgi:hypothetical protein